MHKYMVMTSEYPGDALVVVGWYDNLQQAKEAADDVLMAGREETVAFVIEVQYFVSNTPR